MLKQHQLRSIIAMQIQLDNKIAATRKITNNQAILDDKFLALMVEIAEFANEQRCFKYWSSKPSSIKSILLEEYIDGLHFIISIANQLKLDLLNLTFIEQNYSRLSNAFLDLFAVSLELRTKRNLATVHKWFNIYYTIGKLCGFSGEDIFQGYLDKNQINHQRQEQNY